MQIRRYCCAGDTLLTAFALVFPSLVEDNLALKLSRLPLKCGERGASVTMFAQQQCIYNTRNLSPLLVQSGVFADSGCALQYRRSRFGLLRWTIAHATERGRDEANASPRDKC